MPKWLGKLILYSVILTFAAIGAFTVYQHPAVQELVQKMWLKMNRDEFKNSIAKMYKIKGTNNPSLSKSKRTKITNNTQGLWIVDAAGGEGSDTDKLDDALYSANPMDVIHIRPGEYEVLNLDLEAPVAIQGQGKRPGDIILKVKSKSTIHVENYPAQKVEISNLSIHGIAPSFQAAFLTIRATDLILKNVNILINNQETAIDLKDTAHLDAENSYFSASHRGTAIELYDNSSITVSNSQFINNKNAIYGNIENFDGNIEIFKSKIKNFRAAGVSTYGGTSTVKNVSFEKGLVAIQGRKKSKIMASEVSLNEIIETGIDISDSQAALSKVSISNCGMYGLQITGKESLINISESSIEGCKKALYAYSKPNVVIKNVEIKNNSEGGIRAGKRAVVDLRDSTIDSNGTEGIACSRCDLLVTNSRIDGHQFGINASDKSKITLRNVQFSKNKEDLRNDLLNSEIIRE